MNHQPSTEPQRQDEQALRNQQRLADWHRRNALHLEQERRIQALMRDTRRQVTHYHGGDA